MLHYYTTKIIIMWQLLIVFTDENIELLNYIIDYWIKSLLLVKKHDKWMQLAVVNAEWSQLIGNGLHGRVPIYERLFLARDEDGLSVKESRKKLQSVNRPSFFSCVKLIKSENSVSQIQFTLIITWILFHFFHCWVIFFV